MHRRQNMDLPLSQAVRNWARTLEDVEVIVDQFISDLEAGYISPVLRCPLSLASIYNLTTIKREADGKPVIKHRCIRNASFAEPGTFSVNHNVEKAKVTITTLPA